MGVHVHAEKVLVLAFRSVREWLADPVWVPVAMAASVVAAILVLARLRPGLPASLVAVVLAAVANAALDLGVARISNIPSGLPTPSLPTVPLADLDALVLPAVAVAALAALESLLSATVADGTRNSAPAAAPAASNRCPKTPMPYPSWPSLSQTITKPPVASAPREGKRWAPVL